MAKIKQWIAMWLFKVFLLMLALGIVVGLFQELGAGADFPDALRNSLIDLPARLIAWLIAIAAFFAPVLNGYADQINGQLTSSAPDMPGARHDVRNFSLWVLLMSLLGMWLAQVAVTIMVVLKLDPQTERDWFRRPHLNLSHDHHRFWLALTKWLVVAATVWICAEVSGLRNAFAALTLGVLLTTKLKWLVSGPVWVVEKIWLPSMPGLQNSLQSLGGKLNKQSQPNPKTGPNVQPTLPPYQQHSVTQQLQPPHQPVRKLAPAPSPPLPPPPKPPLPPPSQTQTVSMFDDPKYSRGEKLRFAMKMLNVDLNSNQHDAIASYRGLLDQYDPSRVSSTTDRPKVENIRMLLHQAWGVYKTHRGWP